MLLHRPFPVTSQCLISLTWPFTSASERILPSRSHRAVSSRLLAAIHRAQLRASNISSDTAAQIFFKVVERQ